MSSKSDMLFPLFLGGSDIIIWEVKNPETDRLKCRVRALYGYFQVMVENGNLIVFNPGDSTEIISELPPLTFEGTNLWKKLREESDIMTFSAMHIAEIVDTISQKTRNEIKQTYTGKLKRELQLGLNIPQSNGKIIDLKETNFDEKMVEEISNILQISDRLDVENYNSILFSLFIYD